MGMGMGEHGRGQRQGDGSAFSRGAYGIPLNTSWGMSHSGVAGISSILAGPAPELPRGDERSADPARREFWAWRGAGYRLLVVMAAAHVGAGLLGAAAGALIWYVTRLSSVAPALAALLGAIVAVAGAIAFELARAWGPRATLTARVLLPALDLVVAGVLLRLLDNSALTLMLFVVPALTAALLLSWRSGAVLAAISVSCFAAMNVLGPGQPLEQWATETLALAAVVTIIVLSVGVYAAVLDGVRAALRANITVMRGQRETQAAEQQRLLETLNLLEDAQARLEHERVLVNQQIAEVATTTHRLADGDLSALHALQPGLFGPLEAVRAALARVSLRLEMSTGALNAAQEQRRTLEAVLAANREQAQLLAATDAALRALGVSANELVAEVQVVERGSGELPGIDRRQLFQVMRAMEQRALAQASNTTMLGARLAQLRTRQSEMDADLRQLAQASQPAGNQPEWERSGLYSQQAGAQLAWDEAHHGGSGENSGPWR